MNTPSPLIPQGSLLDQKNKSRAKVKVAFFAVVGVHVAAILTALLAQGCKRDPANNTQTQTEVGQPPVAELVTNTYIPPFSEPTNTIVETPASNYVPPADPGLATQTPTTAVTPPQLTVPPPATAQEYVVQKGDSFSTIAPKFGVTVRAIQDANPNVKPNTMQIGQKLVIPAPTAAATPPANGTGATPAATGETTYTVKAGDNLTKIAAQHGTTVNAIRRANNMTTDRIKVGEKLKIPAR